MGKSQSCVVFLRLSFGLYVIYDFRVKRKYFLFVSNNKTIKQTPTFYDVC